jgi:hypothetical protein
MTRLLTVTLFTFGLLIAGAGRASACGGGGVLSGGMYAFAYPSLGSAGAANLIYTINDGVRGTRMTREEGIGEVITMIPAFALNATAMGLTLPGHHSWWAGGPLNEFNLGVGLYALAQTVWSGALLIHGATKIARGPRMERGVPLAPRARSLALAPTTLADGERRAYGVMVAGRF